MRCQKGLLLKFFSLISDSLGGVDSDREINKEEMVRTSVTASLCWIRQNEKSWRGAAATPSGTAGKRPPCPMWQSPVKGCNWFCLGPDIAVFGHVINRKLLEFCALFHNLTRYEAMVLKAFTTAIQAIAKAAADLFDGYNTATLYMY